MLLDLVLSSLPTADDFRCNRVIGGGGGRGRGVLIVGAAEVGGCCM